MKNKIWNVVLINPPYDGSLHLKFLEKVIEISDKVVSVQPSTFLINIRNDGKAKTKYIPLKNKLDKHVKSCEIDNMNELFKIGMKMPFTIIDIDNTKKFNEIKYNLCGEEKNVNSIFDCNLIGNYDIINSILNKITNLGYKMFINNFLHYTSKREIEETSAFMPVTNRFLTTIGSGHNMNNDSEWIKDDKHNTEYVYSIISSFGSDKITNTRSIGKKGNYVDCIYFNKFNNYKENKEYLLNYYNTVKNSNLFHFIGLTIIIDDQGADKVLKYSPMLNYDHIYSDKELYKLFNINIDEQKIINEICNKFNRKNNFIKKYWNIK